jgi:hypothetical protein
MRAAATNDSALPKIQNGSCFVDTTRLPIDAEQLRSLTARIPNRTQQCVSTDDPAQQETPALGEPKTPSIFSTVS